MNILLQEIGLGPPGIVVKLEILRSGSAEARLIFIKKTNSAPIKSWQQSKERGILMTPALSTQITVV
jgi:hypothetical protein